jgi:predicted deacylase
MLATKAVAQQQIPVIKNLSEITKDQGKHNYWLEMGSNTFGSPLLVPVIIINGSKPGPTFGMTAAIHGNELNGIAIIHQLVATINPTQLEGRIIAIPGLNSVSVALEQREFPDTEDLNRLFPGKVNGTISQQFVYKITERILPAFDVHLDMHTASFGRANSFYIRSDLKNDTLRALALLQQADIILNSTEASAGSNTGGLTMRSMAGEMGIPSITIEYGDPQVYQPEMTARGLKGVQNILGWLGMYGKVALSDVPDTAVKCKKSYWIYTREGGFLEVTVALNESVSKGTEIAVVRDAFGTVIARYTAPEDGIVIGKSTNPVNISGGRILHLGVKE